jgi:hypothetical protein
MAYNTYNYNPCAYHNDAPAVASCGVCGKSMCSKCVNESTHTYDNKPMCKDCTAKMLSERIEAYKKEISWSQIKLVLLIVFLVLGLFIYISDPNNGFTAWVVAGIGGIPSVAKGVFKKSPEERVMDEFMVRTNAEDGCLQILFLFIFRVALTMLFAPLAAIFFCIKNFTNINKYKSALADDQATYDRIVSPARHATGGAQSNGSQYRSNPYQQQAPKQENFYQQAPRAGVYGGRTTMGNADETMYSPHTGATASASIVFNGITFPLSIGTNIIGRRAETSDATVQIPVDDMYMSRQHCIIDVYRQTDGTLGATIGNYKNKNRTVVNGMLIEGTKRVELTNGNSITLGRTTLRVKM